MSSFRERLIILREGVNTFERAQEAIRARELAKIEYERRAKEQGEQERLAKEREEKLTREREEKENRISALCESFCDEHLRPVLEQVQEAYLEGEGELSTLGDKSTLSWDCKDYRDSRRHGDNKLGNFNIREGSSIELCAEVKNADKDHTMLVQAIFGENQNKAVFFDSTSKDWVDELGNAVIKAIAKRKVHYRERYLDETYTGTADSDHPWK